MGIMKQQQSWGAKRVRQAGLRCCIFSKRSTQGQMTVELAVSIPAIIAVAVLVFNAMLFLENCAAFDRIAKDAVRVYAAAPAHGQSPADSAALIQGALEESFSADYCNVSVQSASVSWGFTQYTATLRFTPTLFGRAFSGVVFSTVLGPIEHRTQLTVDPYKPGVVL